MLKNGILKEKIDKYVNNGLYDKNCKCYHEEMLEAFKNATEDEKVEGKEYLRWRLSKNKYNKTDNSNNAILKWIIGIVIVIILVGGIIAHINSNKDEKKNYTYNSSYNYTSDYNTNKTTQYTHHYCDATNCTNEGIYSFNGTSGKEYYCYKHYKQMEEWAAMIMGY